MSELVLLSEENRTFYSLSFKDLFDETKGAGGSLRISGRILNDVYQLRPKEIGGTLQATWQRTTVIFTVRILEFLPERY